MAVVMVGQIEFDITGSAEMEKLLLELGDIVARKIGVQSLKAGAKPVVKEMKRLVRKRTRLLEKSITVSTKRTLSFEQGKGLRTTGMSRIFIGFKKPVSRRAHLTEFGTRFSSAHPFFRPSLDAKAGAALDAMGEQMAKGIEREALKLAKK